MICPGSAHAIIAAEAGKPKGLLRAEQCTGDFNLQEIWVIPPCTEIKSFHRKRSICLKLRGWRRPWDAWSAVTHPFIRKNWLHGLALKVISVSEWHSLPYHCSPDASKWKLTASTTKWKIKSIHNYRGVNSAAWSHIAMAFPNWEMCSAKSHCSKWHLHWSLFLKKGASLPSFCFVQHHLFPTLLQGRPSGTCLTLPRVGSDRPKADRALLKHMGEICAFAFPAPCLPISHVRWSWFQIKLLKISVLREEWSLSVSSESSSDKWNCMVWPQKWWSCVEIPCFNMNATQIEPVPTCGERGSERSNLLCRQG